MKLDDVLKSIKKEKCYKVETRVFNPLERVHSMGERNSGFRVTDSSGYVKLKDRLENFLKAGENLEEWRKMHYDYDAETDYEELYKNDTVFYNDLNKGVDEIWEEGYMAAMRMAASLNRGINDDIEVNQLQEQESHTKHKAGTEELQKKVEETGAGVSTEDSGKNST